MICTFIFASSISAFAEVKTFVKEYTYQASEIDSKVSSRAIALEQVKRLLLEELGTYLESQTEVKDYQLTKEQITSITAGIVQTKIIGEKWNGKEYWLKAKITADPKKVAKAVDSLRKDRQRLKDLEKVNRQALQALREVEKLKKELSSTQKADKAKLKQYNKVIDGLSAVDWIQKANFLSNAGKFNEALLAINKAIKLDPDPKIACPCYMFRSYHNMILHNYDKVIKDMDKILELRQELAIDEKNEATLFAFRGIAHNRLANFEEAIRDFNKAIAMNSSNAGFYHERGAAYYFLNNYPKALIDYTKAIELNPTDSILYTKRAYVFAKLNDWLSTIKDCSKAIQLDPKNSDAYFYRSVAYGNLDMRKQFSKDLKTAASLGNEKAQFILKTTDETE